jgi:hypothetical protein
MEQICNLVYFTLMDGKTTAQIAELEVLLAEPTKKAEMIDRQNAEAQKQLSGFGLLGPPPPKKNKPQAGAS